MNDTVFGRGNQVPGTLTSEQLREVKEVLGLTWDGLAALVGVTPRLVYKWLAGESKVPKMAAGLLWYEVKYGHALRS